MLADLLVIIDNFNFAGVSGFGVPYEAGSPLLVHSDTVLALPVFLQCLQPIPGWCFQFMLRDVPFSRVPYIQISEI